MFWPPGAEPVVLETLGLWNGSGDSGDIDAWQVLMRAVAESGIAPPPFEPHRDEQTAAVTAWVGKYGDRLGELRRCWRVEAAKADLLGLWEAIDNDAPNNVFVEQYDRWSEASADAARAAVGAWQ